MDSPRHQRRDRPRPRRTTGAHDHRNAFAPYEIDQHTLDIGASVGVATAPLDGRITETLIRSADLALYRSKDADGGVLHAYEPQLHVQAEERRVLEMALREALKNGEMHLDYQPVVETESGRLTGFEALLRWRSPQFGMFRPPNSCHWRRKRG